MTPVGSAVGALSRGLCAACCAVLVVTSVGCPADPRQRDPRPVATAGNLQIDQHELLAVLAQRGVARISEPEVRLTLARQFLDQLIEEKIILDAAQEAGIEVNADIVDRELRSRTEGYPPGMFLRVLVAEQLTLDAFRDGVKRRMTQDTFLRSKLAGLPPITDADVEAEYERTLAQQKRPAQVRVRQVLLRSAEEAAHVVEQIRTRRLTMEQAAIRFSEGLEAAEGGDLGWFALGDLPKVFEVCFVLEPGQVSDPQPSEYGYHVFQVIEKRDERIEPLSAVRDRIYERLSAEQQAAAAEAVIAELRGKHPTAVSDETLAAVVALLPDAPVTPIESVEQGGGRPLDSHIQGADPIPPLNREDR